MTPSDRREEIRNFISNKRYTTVAELMDRFHVSKNTILHDLVVLTPTTGFYTISGRGGGIYADDGWYASKIYLTRDQASLLRRLLPELKTEEDRKTMESILYAFGLPADKKTA